MTPPRTANYKKVSPIVLSIVRTNKWNAVHNSIKQTFKLW